MEKVTYIIRSFSNHSSQVDKMLAAASRGCVNIVASLLATGVDPNYCQEDGDPALLTAIKHGHLGVSIRLPS